MNLNFKQWSFLLVFTLVLIYSGGAQEVGQAKEKPSDIHVELSAGIAVPTALGNNFLSKAYAIKTGFTGELALFFNERYFIGYQGVFNEAEVTNTTLVGQYDRSVIRHHYLHGGYSIFPKTSVFGIAAGIGLGHANYKNKKENTIFFDKGFSLMANTKVSYRFSKYVGLYAGVQVSNDFLNIETAPEIQDLFKEARILFVSTGVVFSIGS